MMVSRPYEANLGRKKPPPKIKIREILLFCNRRRLKYKIRKARLESIIHKPIKIRLIPTLYRKPETLAPILKKYVLSPKGWAVSIPGINILLVSDYVPFLIRAEGLVRSVDISKEDLKKDILKNHMPHRKP